jgi:aminocarboxymuconate-semialdehyde decarboxylase
VTTVDVHIHFLSPHALDIVRGAPGRHGVRVLDDRERPRLQIGDGEPTRPLLEPLFTLAGHRQFLAAQSIDLAVFGPLMDVAGYTLPGPQGAAWSRIQNEALAASLAEIGGRHRGLAAVPLQDAELAAAELRFAVRSLGLRGAMIDPNVCGRALGDPGFDPFWNAAAELGVPVVVHPYALEAVERFGRHYLHNLIGYPFETTLAAGSLVLGGTLDRFGALDVVLVHGGGFFPYHVGRFDRAHEARPEARADGARRPSGYLRRFHYDSLLQSPSALAFLVRTVGADRVMLGSDHPFWLGDPAPLDVVRDAGLTSEAETAIRGGNALRLFHLDAVTTRGT